MTAAATATPTATAKAHLAAIDAALAAIVEHVADRHEHVAGGADWVDVAELNRLRVSLESVADRLAGDEFVN